MDNRKKHDIFKIKIGKKIKDAREKMGLSQKELAEKLGIAKEMISFWEAGKRRIYADDMIRVFSELGIISRIGEIAFIENEEPSNYQIYSEIQKIKSVLSIVARDNPELAKAMRGDERSD